ncbi:hypothetical protein GCL60_04010 [Silvanigrella paludirubra]|uniref:Uncharacterized protein n=1 Tax=Silvanigrella paludirubra TaxID=2499159 RepID=A0A6N6VX77_9BACT|nr:hypothetical protein [Silvanigrella paludirubra]KAB8041113.1 hypothetical protein GCL60_04010 [Silvanigrella paludirubra]
MKKLILFLFILILPSLIAAGALYYFFPKDFKNLIDLGKEKIVVYYPFLKKYIHVAEVVKKPVKKEEEPPLKEKIIIPNLHHFTNAEIYAPICGKEVTEKFADLFTGCEFCPKYLINEMKENQFKYISETRGFILKKEEEEAIIFMNGCYRSDQSGSAILIRKGFGGWQRVSVYNNIQFDKEPLEFFEENGRFIFVARRTILKNDEIKQELFSFQFQKNNMTQQNLFSIHMPRGLKCETALQGAIEIPIKMKDTIFQSNLEIVGCNENKLNGMYLLIFQLKDGVFKPNKETSILMTKIEKYGE